MQSPLPTAAQIDALLALWPAVQALREPWLPSEGAGHWPSYHPAVWAFFSEAGRPWWSDYGYVPSEQGPRLQDPGFVAGASLSELRSLLTFCVRSERFGDGAWGALVCHGRLAPVMERLAALRAAMTE